MKYLGEAKFILGIKIERIENCLYLSQEEYLARVLKRLNMINYKGTRTPLKLDIKNSLSKSSCNEENNDSKNFPYREAIGCLMYALLCIRPDLGFPICFLSQFSNSPSKEHWIALKHVLRYVKETLTFKLKYEKSDEQIIGYSDVDWVGDIEKHKSTSGFIFLLGKGPISWGSKKQAYVALSTTEEEYVSLSQATREAIWLRNLMCRPLRRASLSMLAIKVV